MDEPSMSLLTTNYKQIQWKTLVDAPACLQQMLLCLEGYDCTIVYFPGKEMLLADTLSRYAPLTVQEIELDVIVHHVHIGSTHKSSNQELTRTNPLLSSLAEPILGWPRDPEDIPEVLYHHWNHQHMMMELNCKHLHLLDTLC